MVTTRVSIQDDLCVGAIEMKLLPQLMVHYFWKAVNILTDFMNKR